MKKITIKVPGKMFLKDCSWLMDEWFNFLNDRDGIYWKKEIEIIKEDLNLAVCENEIFEGIHDLQIKIIETGEKFYTRSEFLSHGDTEKVLFVPEITCKSNINDECSIGHKCENLTCENCFYGYENQKLWRKTL